MSNTVTIFLFIKATAATFAENLVAKAQSAAAIDTLAKLQTLPEIGEIIVVTPSMDFAKRAAALGCQVETDPIDEDFHWGKTLAELIKKYRPAFPLYIGGGSGALMTAADWRALAQRVLTEPNVVIANNYFSSDFAAWTPGDAALNFEPPPVDNDLAYRLGERAHLRVSPLAKNAATQLDIDTPTDLLTISFHPAVDHHLRAFLNSAQLDTARADRVRALMRTKAATILIAGRVSASMALFLERSTQCQWRIVSEERGMRASGRDERGEVRSVLGLQIDQIGAHQFVAQLAQLADAAIIDSRVLFAHRRLRPSAPDRFHSDLLTAEPICDPWIRDLTLAARDAAIPILLGGHSLVSGGMYALVES